MVGRKEGRRENEPDRQTKEEETRETLSERRENRPLGRQRKACCGTEKRPTSLGTNWEEEPGRDKRNLFPALVPSPCPYPIAPFNLKTFPQTGLPQHCKATLGPIVGVWAELLDLRTSYCVCCLEKSLGDSGGLNLGPWPFPHYCPCYWWWKRKRKGQKEGGQTGATVWKGKGKLENENWKEEENQYLGDMWTEKNWPLLNFCIVCGQWRRNEKEKDMPVWKEKEKEGHGDLYVHVDHDRIQWRQADLPFMPLWWCVMEWRQWTMKIIIHYSQYAPCMKKKRKETGKTYMMCGKSIVLKELLDSAIIITIRQAKPCVCVCRVCVCMSLVMWRKGKGKERTRGTIIPLLTRRKRKTGKIKKKPDSSFCVYVEEGQEKEGKGLTFCLYCYWRKKVGH